MTAKSKGPVLIELGDEASDLTPSDAPAVVDRAAPDTAAMQRAARLAARPRSPLARWFWALSGALLGLVLSVVAWDFVTGLLARNTVLGGVAVGLTGLVLLVLLAIAGRELAAFARLRRLDSLRRDTDEALAAGDLAQARRAADRVAALYSGRQDLAWASQRFAERKAEQFDADSLFALAEAELLAPIDRAAEAEIETAARQVATVTAIVPLALADVVAALTANFRMIRRIAELYGGRAGALGNWRLTRSVLTHLVATGAVAVGDDLIGSVAGGGVVAKLSRRFGEGIVNGALTARVGVAAMEVCRPLAFRTASRPSVTGLVRRALTGFFG